MLVLCWLPSCISQQWPPYILWWQCFNQLESSDKWFSGFNVTDDQCMYVCMYVSFLMNCFRPWSDCSCNTLDLWGIKQRLQVVEELCDVAELSVDLDVFHPGRTVTHTAAMAGMWPCTWPAASNTIKGKWELRTCKMCFSWTILVIVYD